jgi:hypothetical protein
MNATTTMQSMRTKRLQLHQRFQSHAKQQRKRLADKPASYFSFS